MAELVIPELFIGEAVGAEALGAGFGLEAGADAAFGAEAAGAGAEAAGAGAEATFAGAGEAIGTAGLEAGSGALEALGGFGFEAPATAETFIGGGFEGAGAIDPAAAAASPAAEAGAQGGIASAGSVQDISTEAISALNEGTLGSPELSNAPGSTDLGSIGASDTPATDSLTTPDQGIINPSSEELGARPDAGPSSASTQGPDQGLNTQETVSGDQPPTQQAADASGRAAGAGRAAGTGQAGAGSGAGGFNPGQLLSSLAKLAQPKPSSPYLPQGAGYGTTLGDFGTQQINQYNSGQLRPEDLQTIMNNQRAALNKMRQFYAQSGNSNSTAARQAEAKINADSVAQQVQFFNQYLTSGMQALGQASSALLNAAQIDLRNQTAYNQAQSSALSSLGSAFAGAGKGGGTGTNTNSGNNAGAQPTDSAGSDGGGGSTGDYSSQDMSIF